MGHEVLPVDFAAAMCQQIDARGCVGGAGLCCHSCARKKDPPALVLIFHRLLLEVVRDWTGTDARWSVGRRSGAASGRRRFHTTPTTIHPSWPLCARLMPHVAPLDAYAPRNGSKPARRFTGCSIRPVSISHGRGDRAGALSLAEKSVALLRTTRSVRASKSGQSASAIWPGSYTQISVGWTRRRRPFAKRSRSRSLVSTRTIQAWRSHSPTSPKCTGSQAFAKAEPLFLRAAEITRPPMRKSRRNTVRRSLISARSMAYWADEPGHWQTRAGGTIRDPGAGRDSGRARPAASGRRRPATTTSPSRSKARTTGRAQRRKWSVRWRSCCRSTSPSILTAKWRAHSQHGIGREFSQPDKAARLASGDISDLLPVIAQIEAEHRAWVAEDPRTAISARRPRWNTRRHRWKIIPTDKRAAKLIEVLAQAGVDVENLTRRIEAGEVTEDDFKKIVAAALAKNKG